MYFKASEQSHDIKENLRGGVGALDFQNIIPPEMMYGSGNFMSIITFEPGQSIGLHSHENNFEVYCVLEGQALVEDNGEERILEKGDSEICANGGEHGIKNVSDKPAKVLAVLLNNFERK